MPQFNGSTRRDDVIRFDVSELAMLSADLGDDYDLVVLSDEQNAVDQVRLTFTSSEVGNGDPDDSNTMANQDGGLAVRVQAEDAMGNLTGPVGRTDDEGISFFADGSFTFDVRDLVSGVQRGDQFDVVRLGTLGGDRYNEGDSALNYYINAGQGDDAVTGGSGDDFLVGGAGDDALRGEEGEDSFIGGGGNDRISGGLGNDLAIFNVTTDGADAVNLGEGNDRVNVAAGTGVTQIRLTFTSSEVGNNSARDSNSMANQDGGFAVRLQAEDGSDGLTGLVSRFDDEGITFTSTTPGVTFDVRDLVSGVARGDQFQAAALGTRFDDVFNRTAETGAQYVNAGAGADRLNGGTGNDFLVGGLGDDLLRGNEGDDSHIGGMGADRFVFSGTPGDDRIIDFTSGTDKIDLRAFRIGFDDVEQTMDGAANVLGIDTNGDDMADFTITLVNGAMPVAGDFLF